MHVRIRHHDRLRESAPCCSLPGSGGSPVAVSASVTGLTRNTTYHFRISATNTGSTSEGATKRSRRRHPGAPDRRDEGRIVGHPDVGDAERHGESQRQRSQPMQVRIRDDNCVRVKPAVLPSRGPGRAPWVSASVTGLMPNTTYHFRICATSPAGTSEGADERSRRRRPPPRDGSGIVGHAERGDPECDGEPQRRRSQQMHVRIRHHDGVREQRAVLPSPGAGASPVAVSASVAGLTGTPPTTSGSAPPTQTGRVAGATKRSRRCRRRPRRREGAASSVGQMSATLNATVNPNGAEVSECTFEYGATTAYGQSAQCSPLPGPAKARWRFGVDHGPRREHHLPLQDLRDQHGRDERRSRRNVQNAGAGPRGRDETGLLGDADHGDPERHREPQRRGSQQMHV